MIKKLMKKAKLDSSVMNTAMLAIILLVVLFEIYAATVPTAQAAGDKMNVSNQCNDAGCHYNISQTTCFNSSTDDVGCATNTGIPLAGLFSGQGIVFLIIMAALIILVVRAFMPSKK